MTSSASKKKIYLKVVHGPSEQIMSSVNVDPIPLPGDRRSAPCLLPRGPRRRWFFCFNDTATTEIYTLSLHDALPILVDRMLRMAQVGPNDLVYDPGAGDGK